MICRQLSLPDDDVLVNRLEKRLLLTVAEKGAKLWARGTTINVFFLDRHKNQGQVLPIARQWSEHCSIGFAEVDDANTSDVRVSFKKEGNFSYVGQEVHNRAKKDKRTMNLQDFDPFTILHEFGHVLGFEHEHQSPIGGNIRWNRDRIIEAFRGPPNYWEIDMIDSQVLTHLGAETVAGSPHDRFSIMHYRFAKEFIESINGKPPVDADIPVINSLSDMDKRVAATLFGARDSGSSPSPPRISKIHGDKYDIKAGEGMRIPVRIGGSDAFKHVIETTGSEAALTFSLMVGPEGEELLLAVATSGGNDGNPLVVRRLSPSDTHCLFVQAFERGGEFGVEVRPFDG